MWRGMGESGAEVRKNQVRKLLASWEMARAFLDQVLEGMLWVVSVGMEGRGRL